MKEVIKVKQHFQENYERHGVAPEALSWKGKGAAHQRFRQIWAEIDFNDKSVLDIGCGFGEMGRFLAKRYENVDYLGIDIVPEFIEEAKKQNPNLKFEVKDVFSDEIEQKYDVVIASGVLNSNVGDNMKYRKRGIKRMYKLAKKVFVFNMLGGHPQPENKSDSNVWYADSLEILEYCLSLTRRVLLRHHYNPRDFTIFMYPVQKK
jgi:SAM-dependent methyltransferase